MGKPTTWEKTKVLDRTRALYGPRTQAYGVTKYLRINKGFGQNQGIVWSSDSSLWGNQLPKKQTKVLDRTKAFYGSWTQAYGETNYLRNKQRFWTEPMHCIVLGLKPMGKPTTWKKKQKFWTEPRHCMVLGLKPIGKPTTTKKNYKFWTEPRPCMVLRLKPLGKPTT